MDDLDDELVGRIRAGETNLYDTLMHRHHQRLYRIARVILRNPEEAEDVVQEAYVRAYAHLSQFAGAAKFSTWLTKIAVHEALARLRKRRRIAGADPARGTEKDSGMENLESAIPNPETQALEKQTLEILEAAVEAMPDNLRAVFVMREMEEMSTAETAECLGLSGGEDPLSSCAQAVAPGSVLTRRRPEQPGLPVSWRALRPGGSRGDGPNSRRQNSRLE